MLTPFGWTQLSGKRRIGISEFKGKRMMNIREYYEKDGEVLPGKKVGAFFAWGGLAFV